MLIYLLKFSACLALFMVFYKLLLEKSSIHNFKRFYLLGALTTALIIPSLTFIEYIEPLVYDSFEMIEPLPTMVITDAVSKEVSIDYASIILWSIYGLGVFIFLLKFSLNLYKIIKRIKNNPKLKSAAFINVLVTNLVTPHTFFSYIFLNKHKFEHAEIPQEVLLHEQTHAKQKHSLDVLILELTHILFWFNPLIYLLKKEVKLNHEFLADRAVLRNGIQPSAYQQLLLAFSSNASEPQLANAINYSSIKKRFTVMKTNTSKPSIWLRSLLVFPLLALMLYSFTERKQIVKAAEVPVQNYISEGVSEAQMKEYNEFIIAFNTTHTINHDAYERIVSIYNLMTEKQKASVEPYPKIPGIDLSKTKAKTPTKEQFESWKNEKEFAIWLDGVHIPNVKLNSYALDDIAHYVGSFAHKNARSERFPQPYQFSLYTKKGFETTYQQSQVKTYRSLSQKYSDAIQIYLKERQTDNSELKLLYERASRLYKSFTKEELKKYKLLPPPPPPAAGKSTNNSSNAKEWDKVKQHLNPSASSKNQTQPMWILLNNKGQFLVDDELGSLETIEAEFKSIANDKRRSKKVNFKHDPKAPKAMVTNLVALIKKYKLENISGDNLLVPPPPPRPEKVKTGNGPNAENYNDYPIPPAIPENATPEQREKMQRAIDEFEHKYKRKVHQIKSENGMTYNMIVNDEEYDPNNSEAYKTKTGFIKINGQAHYFVTIDNKTKYYNRNGFEVSKAGDVISPSQVNASDVIPNQYITKVFSDGKIMTEFKDNIPSRDKKIMDIPSPPKPLSALDFIIDMAKKNAKFYYENKAISSDEAISLLKQHPELNVLAKPTTNEQPLVYLSKEPIRTQQKYQKSKALVSINGKTPINDQLNLTIDDFKSIKLTLETAEVISFKFKVPGKPTEHNKGYTLNDKSKSYLKALSSETVVQFFDIKDSKGFVHPPVVVSIKTN
ncbi:M56 family metallopeptidase [Psychroserpens sp. SPM9]|uniref:M56 family metallopeptidase n=1 Tax=Psychroserpens sp. SPM9 TaxID=2975598 RepID=UPI0021A63785|nr:M56 family metallopeptidase [Psychroserpens sp. SPM9]MDG5490314.1 M56 family metallopeptidase [Psychroserpens sp. SPM9]